MKNDCIKRNYELKNVFLDSPIHLDRINILKKFIGKSKSVLDVGCGAFMPIVLKINNACDVDELSHRYLKKGKWKGKFKVASVTNLPYNDKEFKKLILSEVIEHLKSKKGVLKAFEEIDRVSENWIVTTPCAYDRDPDHNFHFGYNDDNLFDFIPEKIKKKFYIVWRGYYYYISNDKSLLEITGVKNGRRD